MKKITVIGCGVIGLTTAICLERAGYKVRMVTKALHHKSTSAVAAAIWLPFKAEPIELVNQWSLETYHIFEKISLDPISGVYMKDYVQLCHNDEPLPWQSAIPASAIRKANAKELPPSYSFGYVASVPIIETPVYLEYLFDEFRGEILIDEVLDFKELEAHDTLVINCTGLGAQSLLEDPELYPIKGQVVKIKAMDDAICMADDDPNYFFYIISRSDGVVLGGSAEAYHYGLQTDDAITQTIIDRTSKVNPKIKASDIISVEVGLRPYRSAIRLEKDPSRNIIHNYGHGGSGFTVSWGCARAVLELVRAF